MTHEADSALQVPDGVICDFLDCHQAQEALLGNPSPSPRTGLIPGGNIHGSQLTWYAARQHRANSTLQALCKVSCDSCHWDPALQGPQQAFHTPAHQHQEQGFLCQQYPPLAWYAASQHNINSSLQRLCNLQPVAVTNANQPTHPLVLARAASTPAGFKPTILQPAAYKSQISETAGCMRMAWGGWERFETVASNDRSA